MSKDWDKGKECCSRACSRRGTKQVRLLSLSCKIITTWSCSFPVFWIIGPEKIRALKLPDYSRGILEQTSVQRPGGQ